MTKEREPAGPTDPIEPTGATEPEVTGHPMLVYTGWRLVLFVVPLGILLALQVDLVWALLIAALLSSFASIFVLSRFRNQMSVSLSQRKERIRLRMIEREQAEDAWDDAHRQADEPDSDAHD